VVFLQFELPTCDLVSWVLGVKWVFYYG
jgi:hypothetical protein